MAEKPAAKASGKAKAKAAANNERYDAFLVEQRVILDRQLVALNAIAAKQDIVLDMLRGHKLNFAENTSQSVAETTDAYRAPPASEMSSKIVSAHITPEPSAGLLANRNTLTLRASVQSTPSHGLHGFNEEARHAIDKIKEEEQGIIIPDTKTSRTLKSIVDNTKTDCLLGFIIFLNLTTLLTQVQLQGHQAGDELGLSATGVGSAGSSNIFFALDITFNTLYLIELIIRAYLFRFAILRNPIQALDSVLVVVLCFDAFVLQGEGIPGLRFLRVLRIVRILKVVRFMSVFTELRVLLKTISWSVGSLCWSMIMLMLVTISTGTMMCQLVQASLENGAYKEDHEVWLWNNFGTISSSCYVLFEATFTGTWTRYSRYMIDELSPLYAFFWIPYITIVNFAIMRVISALFLKQTMNAAHTESLKLAMGKMVIRTAYTNELNEAFSYSDEHSEGVLTRERFEELMHDPHFLDVLAALDLDRLEMLTLFELLKNDADTVDYEALLGGCLTMKSSSPCLDSIQLLHGQTLLKRQMARMFKEVKSLRKDDLQRETSAPSPLME